MKEAGIVAAMVFAFACLLGVLRWAVVSSNKDHAERKQRRVAACETLAGEVNTENGRRALLHVCMEGY